MIVSVTCEAALTPLVARTLEILTRTLWERGGLEAVLSHEDGRRADLCLAVSPGIGTEGFRIERDGMKEAWRVTGNDERGLLYGVGRFLRGCHLGDVPRNRTLPLGYDGWTGTSVPRLAVRGMYFASHFHNYYHDAPLDEVERYVEELALWGCNALSVWFDMHHYAGIDEPAAQAMIARLHAILKAANRVGMAAALTSLANEAYHTSPADLRAEPFPHHYHVELCPSRPGGLDLILRWRQEMLEAFADLEIGYFWIWPYDQGGCRCADCKPWGGNGFLRNAEAVARLVRRTFPRARTVVSTWEFGYWEGDPEWDRFYAAMAEGADWADLVMAEGHGDFPPYVLRNGPPAGRPLLNFPEISMSGMGPWGGFGANLQPARLQKVWNACSPLLAGGFPYSEGIYEDLNKVVCLQLYWDPDRSVEDIVREYAAAEYTAEAADEVCEAVYLLESNMGHSIHGPERLREGLESGDGVLYLLENVRDPERAVQLLERAAGHMNVGARRAWRWRILWLRAALDLELTRSEGRATSLSEACFQELCGIAHAEGAAWSVCIPDRRTLERLLTSGNDEH